MMLWGSTIDASMARKYELPLIDTLLPPLTTSHDGPVLAPTSTKSHPKPTAHLPGDHGTAEGENHKPAFPGSADTAEPSSSTPTPDEGWFSDMSSLISGKKWFFGAVGAVAIFGIGAGVFFWRRSFRQRRKMAQYSTVAGDEVAMSSIGRNGRLHAGGGTKELYDAFGELSDDDDDADEETGLRGGRPQDRISTGLGFHSGFLDDDEQEAAHHTPIYKDEPDDNDRLREDGVRSPSSASGDGSWEHASQTR
jgi:kexin